MSDLRSRRRRFRPRARARSPGVLRHRRSLRIVFRTTDASPGAHRSLPATVEAAVHGLMNELAGSEQGSAVAIISPTQTVRLLRLEAEDGANRYAVLLERFAARSSAAKAAQRFGLSSREAQVLEGLMRGESTNEIARELGIAITTVQERIRKIGYKTNVTNAARSSPRCSGCDDGQIARNRPDEKAGIVETVVADIALRRSVPGCLCLERSWAGDGVAGPRPRQPAAIAAAARRHVLRAGRGAPRCADGARRRRRCEDDGPDRPLPRGNASALRADRRTIDRPGPPRPRLGSTVPHIVSGRRMVAANVSIRRRVGRFRQIFC